MNREVFVALYDGQVLQAMPFRSGGGVPLAEMVEMLAAAHNAQGEDGDPQLDTAPERYTAFSWNIEPLDGGLLLAQVPRPGVVLLVHDAAPERAGVDQGGPAAVAVALRHELDKGDDRRSQRFHEFVGGPGARRRPLPMTTTDVFISFHPADRATVEDIGRRLDGRGRSHVASARGASEQARAAMSDAALVLCVVSPRSVGDPWVLCEMGAAWALDRPLVPARLDLDPHALPYLMAAYQSRSIGSGDDRERLVADLDAFLTVRVEG